VSGSFGYTTALLLSLCAWAAPAAAAVYTFRSVADQTGGFTNFDGGPVINDAGDVAFAASTDDGDQGIYGGPDPDTDVIADDSGPYDFPLDFPSIAADGTVAFRAWLDPTPELFLGGRGIFTGPDPDFDTVADDTGPVFGDFHWPSIADDGTVAFGAITPFGSFGIFTGDDPATDTVADESGPFTEPIFVPAINAEGTVAFYAELDAGGGGIFTGDDPVTDTVADASGSYALFDFPAINDDGTVIFRATLDAGGEGIFRGPSATADRIVGTGGPYAGFSGYAINGAGTVVFGATLDAGGLGLFTGPSPANDKVIAVGDALFGSTVSFVDILRECLNDNGEVAFLYELADGRSGIAVAAPGALARSLDAGDFYDGVRLTSAAGSGTVARLRDGIAADDRELALSFAASGPASDALTLTGTADDTYVLELTYEGSSGDESGFRLYERAPGSGPWQPAVLRNTPSGGPFFANTSFDEYRTGLGGPPALGAHGSDPETDTVWAVLDHDGVFAVPEPAPGAAAAAALLVLVALRRRVRVSGAARRIFGLGLVVAIAARAAAGEPANTLTPVLAAVIAAPAPARLSDGLWHLPYELALTNVADVPMTIESIEVRAADAPGKALATLSGDALHTALALPGATRTATLGPAQAGVLFVELEFTDREQVPPALVHRLAVTAAEPKPPLPARTIADVARVNVSAAPPLELGPPLRGERWVAAASCCESYHRRALLPIDGARHLAQRFAIDWIQLDPEYRLATGDAKHPESYPQYGREAIAVADAEVVSVVDGLPEAEPGSFPPGVTIQTADGNHVVLDLGGGRFALYAHLQPGSLRVAPGDRVERGRVLGLVGNSGNSDAPHLHFHVMDGPSPLAANGLPYAIDAFAVRGVAASKDDLDTELREAPGKPVAITPAQGAAQQRGTLPVDLAVVDFAP
jgi:hypothetical protein